MRVLITGLLLILFLSCNKENKADGDFYEIPIPNIDAVLLLNTDSTALKLVLRSRELVGAGILITECNRIDTSFKFYIHKALIGKNPIVDTVGDAKFIYQFPFLQTGEYLINVKIDNRTENNGKLIVSEHKFEIKMDSLSEIGFPLGNIVEY